MLTLFFLSSCAFDHRFCLGICFNEILFLRYGDKYGYGQASTDRLFEVISTLPGKLGALVFTFSTVL